LLSSRESVRMSNSLCISDILCTVSVLIVWYAHSGLSDSIPDRGCYYSGPIKMNILLMVDNTYS
jgi:hypothetical protein